MQKGKTCQSHPTGSVFPLFILPTIGFPNQRYDFPCWGKCHEINRGICSYLYFVIVPVFAISVMYPPGTIEKVILSVHDMYSFIFDFATKINDRTIIQASQAYYALRLEVSPSSISQFVYIVKSESLVRIIPHVTHGSVSHILFGIQIFMESCMYQAMFWAI